MSRMLVFVLSMLCVSPIALVPQDAAQNADPVLQARKQLFADLCGFNSSAGVSGEYGVTPERLRAIAVRLVAVTLKADVAVAIDEIRGGLLPGKPIDGEKVVKYVALLENYAKALEILKDSSKLEGDMTVSVFAHPPRITETVDRLFKECADRMLRPVDPSTEVDPIRRPPEPKPLEPETKEGTILPSKDR